MMQVNHDSNCYFYVSEYNNVCEDFHLNVLMNYLICCTSFLSNAPIQYRQRQKISITALHDTYARLNFQIQLFGL